MDYCWQRPWVQHRLQFRSATTLKVYPNTSITCTLCATITTEAGTLKRATTHLYVYRTVLLWLRNCDSAWYVSISNCFSFPSQFDIQSNFETIWDNFNLHHSWKLDWFFTNFLFTALELISYQYFPNCFY